MERLEHIPERLALYSMVKEAKMKLIIDIPEETCKNIQFYGLYLNPRDKEVLEKALKKAVKEGEEVKDDYKNM